MPNWCCNSLIIQHEDKTKIDEFVNEYKQGRVCDHYIPLPRDAAGELISDPKAPGYWWLYAVNNWGTKWDIGSDNDEAHGRHPIVVDNQATMSFDSAWAPPLGLYARLRELGFDVRASYWEPGMAFAGRWVNGVDSYYEGGFDAFPDDLKEEYNMDEFYNEE